MASIEVRKVKRFVCDCLRSCDRFTAHELGTSPSIRCYSRLVSFYEERCLCIGSIKGTTVQCAVLIEPGRSHVGGAGQRPVRVHQEVITTGVRPVIQDDAAKVPLPNTHLRRRSIVAELRQDNLGQENPPALFQEQAAKLELCTCQSVMPNTAGRVANVNRFDGCTRSRYNGKHVPMERAGIVRARRATPWLCWKKHAASTVTFETTSPGEGRGVLTGEGRLHQGFACGRLTWGGDLKFVVALCD